MKTYGKILVFGDSIAYGKWDGRGGWVARLREYVDGKYNPVGNVQVYNLGISGEVAVRMVNRVKQELEFRETGSKDEVLVIFAVGVNDSCPNNWMTKKQTPESEFKKAIRTLVGFVMVKGFGVVVVGLAPVNPARSKGLRFTNEEVKRYDDYISDVCGEMGVKKIELFETLKGMGYVEELVDSVHPNSEGHEMIFERVREALRL